MSRKAVDEMRWESEITDTAMKGRTMVEAGGTLVRVFAGDLGMATACLLIGEIIEKTEAARGEARKALETWPATAISDSDDEGRDGAERKKKK